MILSSSKFYSFIFNRRTLSYLVVLIVCVFFDPIIKLSIDHSLVILFKRIDPKWLIDYTVIASAGLIIFYFNYNVGKKVPSIIAFDFWTIVILFYSYHRFLSNYWEFVPMKLCTCYSYSDILFIFYFSYLLLFIPNRKEIYANTNLSFLNDTSLGSKKEDELNYRFYATSLVHKILVSNFNSAFAIGVTGKWGVGKTSFLDLMKAEITKNQSSNIIEIDFNPWSSNSSSGIIQDFFDNLQEAIKPYYTSISNLLNSYSNKLIKLEHNKIAKTAGDSIGLLNSIASIKSLQKEIVEALKKIDKKIIIYVDDLDRLNKEEIEETLKLIRNTANFNNLFFIVTYDKEYIISELSAINHNKNYIFLEKIFQLEINLPFFNKEILRKKLASNLKYFFSEVNPKLIDDAVSGYEFSFGGVDINLLDNLRDVTRLSNSLALNLKDIFYEVELRDYINIEIIRLKFPIVYQLLYYNYNFFLDSKPFDSVENSFSYKLTNSEELDKILKISDNNIAFSKNEIENLHKLLNYLFPSFNYIQGGAKAHLSIRYPSQFKRYFTYTLLEGSLAYSEFAKGRSMTQNEFNSKIDQWVQSGFSSDVEREFRYIKSYDNKEDFEKIIKSIFYFASTKNVQGVGFYGSITNYNFDNLLYKMRDHDGVIARLYHSDINIGKKEYEKFVIKIFDEALSPYSYESLFLNHIYKNISVTQDDSFPLSENQIIDVLLRYLEIYCESVKTIDVNVWGLYYNCIKIDVVSRIGGSVEYNDDIDPRANDIMKRFVQKDFVSFLKSLIKSDMGQNKIFKIDSSAVHIYGSWESFENELNKNDWNQLPLVKEVIDFFYKYKNAGFKGFIEYRFNF